MKTPPTFVQLIFCPGFLSLAHCLCHFGFWGVVAVTNLLSPPFIFWTFLFLHKLFHAFHLVLEFSVSFSPSKHFLLSLAPCSCNFHGLFCVCLVWMASQSFECNTSKRCNRTFEIQVLLVHVPTPLQRSPSFYVLFVFRMALSSG